MFPLAEAGNRLWNFIIDLSLHHTETGKQFYNTPNMFFYCPNNNRHYFHFLENGLFVDPVQEPAGYLVVPVKTRR